ncbi:MAG: hypothetical protein A2Z35_01450 [Actinobacteria bacterium RBG_19FT_COMBO_36_27]|nr:MAG: hypothetical protein A2Z35_01450 [Actinobacteria bacterium RBG_19FT_COMBO_36_27]
MKTKLKPFTPFFKYPNNKTIFEGVEKNGKIVQDIDEGFLNKTWWPSFFPSLICYVTSGGSDETNIMTTSCITVVDRWPFMIGFPAFCGRGSDDELTKLQKRRYTLDLIDKHKEFTVNIAHIDKKLIRGLIYCGSFSGKDTDKFRMSGLTKIESSKIKTPIIKECPLNFECKLHSITPLGTHSWIMGEVVAVHLDKEFLEGKKQFFWRSLPEVIEK